METVIEENISEFDDKLVREMAYLTPKKVVEELDKYIIGQKKAKKSVAIALRNRYRRSLLPRDLIEEVIPKNILMIGPTGVGKTEIARRLARLANSPFIKVEATKYTEVGYVGRDVESMVRDLIEIGIRMVRQEKYDEVKEKAEEQAINRIMEAFLPKQEKPVANPFQMIFMGAGQDDDDDDDTQKVKAQPSPKEDVETYKEHLRHKIKTGEFDDLYVKVEIEENPNMDTINIFSQAGMEEMGVDFQSILGNFFPKKKVRKNMKIKEAKKTLAGEEARKLIDQEEVKVMAIRRVEQHGIIFIDEMDKIAGREKGYGPDVSREGVQRDILPIVEGSTIVTKYGPVRTDHILFIGAGAFNVSKPSDLIPELQGRFPIRVELDSLFKDDFIQILLEPKNALTKQYKALMETEGVNIEFTQDGIEQIAELSQTVNETTENIGARRLHTIMEKLLEEVSFEAPDIEEKDIKIDAQYVKTKLKDIVQNQDLSRFVL